MADPRRVQATGGGLQAVADMLNLFGGQKTTQRTTADTSAIQRMLGELQGQDFSGVADAMFQRAAGQIPGLQARYANAVGARTGDNTAVQGALNKVMQDTTLAATDRVLQAQQQNQRLQADLAGALAQATRQQTTQQRTDLGKGAKGLGGLQLLGKTGIFDDDNLGRARTGLMDLFTREQGPQLLNTVGPFAQEGATAVTSAAPAMFESVADTGFGDTGWTGLLSGLANTGSSIGNWFSSGLDTVRSWFGYADGGLVGRDGVPMYRDGGHVRRPEMRKGTIPRVELDLAASEAGMSRAEFLKKLNEQEKAKKDKSDGSEKTRKDYDRTSKMVDQKTGIRFADGGMVALRAGGGRRSSAPMFTPDDPASTPALLLQQGLMAPPPAPMLPAVPTVQAPVEQEFESIGGEEGVSMGNPSGFTALAPQALGQVGQGVLGMVAPAVNPALGLALAMLGVSKSPAQATKGLMGVGMTEASISNSLSKSPDPIASLMMALPHLTITEQQAVTPGQAMGLGSDAMAAAANAVASVTGMDPMDALMSVTDAFGTASGTASVASDADAVAVGDEGTVGFGDMGFGDGGGDGGGGGGGSAGPGGPGGASPSSGPGDGSDGTGGTAWKHGGEVSGPGTGTSDSIHARLSDGEYVIPADVVDRLGVGFFDALRANLHTPVATHPQRSSPTQDRMRGAKK